jgi:EthD domain
MFFETGHAADLIDCRRGRRGQLAACRMNGVLQQEFGGAPEPYDGVAELWFETLDALASKNPAVPQASADVLADAAKFIDMERSPIHEGSR